MGGLVLTGLLALGAVALPQEDESEAEPALGWIAAFATDDAQVRTVVPAAAFVLEHDEGPHPEVGAGFSGVYVTRLQVESEGDYRFAVEAEGGSASLELLPGVAPDAQGWRALARGEVTLMVSFDREPGQAALLRPTWERRMADGRGFPPEPIPVSATRVPPELEAAAAGGVAGLEGRVLLERKGCTNCHDPGPAEHAVGRRAGPELERAGARLSASYLFKWLTAPQAIRPHGDMPGLFTSGETDVVRDVVHYLASLAEGEHAEAAAGSGGRELYHRVGCVACHGARVTPAVLYDDPFLPDTLPSAAGDPPPAPLDGVEHKWRSGELARMLLDPAAVYPDGRMPSLDLSEAEAGAIAAYLVDGPVMPPLGAEPERVERGREAYLERGCGSCHTVSGERSAVEAPTLASLDPTRGCMDPEDEETPRYDLDDAERALLSAGIASARAVAGPHAPLDAAQRDMRLLGCRNCHAIDGAGGVGEDLGFYFVSNDEADLGDEGRLAPDLSGVGHKLTTQWMRDLLLHGERSRPYVATRMPSYDPGHVANLPRDLGRMVGVRPDHGGPDEPVSTDAQVLTGRGLMDRTQLSCVACHVYADAPPNGTVGPDMTRFAERVRYEWFRSFLWDPSRYKAGTKMPSFGGAGVSTLGSVLDGDMAAQIDAMWCYFALGEFMPPPEALRADNGNQLAVGERPRVVRTFLETAGSRGIAVGFPLGIHFAFDATEVRLVDVWRGSFLDASGAWAGRGGNPAGGRGPVIWSATEGHPIHFVEEGDIESVPTEVDAEDAGYAFQGYRLDPDGAPRFLYTVRGVSVQERWRPRVAPEGFAREFVLTGVPAERWVVVRAGAGCRGIDGAGFEVVANAKGEGETMYILQSEATSGVTDLSFTLEMQP